jgi:tRNA-guanine family transglycosylase
MGKLVNFCAGADPNKLPAKQINALLVNVPDHGANERKIEKAKKMFEIAQPKNFMLDSGGFQLLMAEEKSRKITFDPKLPVKHTLREINLTPKHVMEAASILKPDMVVGLDFPIRKIKDPMDRQIEFINKLEYNVKWAYESFEWHKKLCPDTKFFLPIQCYDLEQLEIFFNRIAGLYFDGVSMPIRGLKIWEIALFLVRFYQLGIKRVHLLGTYSFLKIALSAYMARHMFDWVSFDATSWRIAADHAEYFNLCDLSRVILISSAKIGADITNDCSCQFCSGQSFNQLKNVPFKQRVALLRGHNWYAADKAFCDLYKNSENVIQLDQFLKKRSRRLTEVNKLCSTLSIIDALKDFDIAELERIIRLTVKGQKKVCNRKSINVRKQTMPA